MTKKTTWWFMIQTYRIVRCLAANLHHLHRKKVVIFIPLLGISLLLSATTYYVKVDGNDANSGLNDVNAWAHHPWMKGWTGSTVLKAGDRICMKRGDNWTIANLHSPYITVVQSGTPGHPIVTTAYGTGARPIINVSTNSGHPVISSIGNSYITFDNLEISHFSSAFLNSHNNGISIRSSGSKVPHDWVITNCEIHDIPHSAIIAYHNCYNMVVGDTSVKKTATTSQHSNHVHNFGYAGIMLQGVNPSTLVSNNYICYNYVHDATQTGAKFQEYGIIFTVSSPSAGWPKYCYGCYNNVQNIKTWEGMDIHGGSYIFFTDNYIKNFGACGIHTMSRKVGTLPVVYHHIYIERNIIEQPPSGWVTGRENCFILHFDAEDAVSSDIYIRNNKCFYTSRPKSGKFFAIRAGNTDGLIISGNEIYNGATISARAGILITDNYGTYGNKNVTITGNFIRDWGPGINISGSTVKGLMSVTKNIIERSPGKSIIVTGNVPSTGSLEINNNKLISGASHRLGTSYGIASVGSSTDKNNILGRSITRTLHYRDWRGTVSTLSREFLKEEQIVEVCQPYQ